jgi:hypothetical protein
MQVIWKFKLRVAIWLGEVALGIICWQAMVMGYSEVAMGSVVAIAALLPKLVESEEKGK